MCSSPRTQRDTPRAAALWAGVPLAARALVAALMDPNEKTRPTAAKAGKSLWLAAAPRGGGVDEEQRAVVAAAAEAATPAAPQIFYAGVQQLLVGGRRVVGR